MEVLIFFFLIRINSTTVFFFNIIFVGTFISASSNNWVIIWAGLEISLMSFIPIIRSNLILSSESSIKYFIIQGVSSSILIFGVITILIKTGAYLIIIYISLIIRIGMSPFHNWLLGVLEGLNFLIVYILLTVARLTPLIILSYLPINLDLFIILSLLFGSLGGLSQTSLRKILGYSSIFNIGFLISLINNNSLWFVYLLLYSLILMCILLIFSNLIINYINQLIINEFNLINKITIWVVILSLGGIPPILGFISKLITIEFLIVQGDLLIVLIIIFLSLVVIFFYTRVSFLSMIIFSLVIKWSLLSQLNSIIFLLIINVIIIPLFLIFKCFN